MKRYDYVVVGAGLSGCCMANLLSAKGNKVLIIEKRSHIGGNIFDKVDDETGIIVQQYGPHIFHTNDEKVYNYITKFSIWEKFILKCGVEIDGIFTPSPFNFKTIDQFFNSNEIKENLLKEYPNDKTVTIVELLNSKNEIIKKYAEFLFDKDYSLYTAKQWGIKPSEVDVNVLKRVPVRLDYNEMYFTDKYQIMPKYGFTEVITEMIKSNNIDIYLERDFLKYISFKDCKLTIDLPGAENAKVIYTGPIDALFNYKYGLLPYRSLDFIYKKFENTIQEYPVVAYPSAIGYTRITDYSLLPLQNGSGTIVAEEYPKKYTLDSKTDPYYPINNEVNDSIYQRYYEEAKKYSNLILCGRLSLYKYYNMDQIIRYCLDLYEDLNKDE